MAALTQVSRHLFSLNLSHSALWTLFFLDNEHQELTQICYRVEASPLQDSVSLCRCWTRRLVSARQALSWQTPSPVLEPASSGLAVRQQVVQL